jgi:tetratricopeptide (TPR) repeat protein
VILLLWTIFLLDLISCLCCTQVSLVKVGITLLLVHRFEDALWSFREALSVRKNALGALHPSTARIYNNIGCVHVEFNEFREARRAFEAALDIQRNALSQDPDSGPLMFGAATTLCNLGYLYRYDIYLLLTLLISFFRFLTVY